MKTYLMILFLGLPVLPLRIYGSDVGVEHLWTAADKNIRRLSPSEFSDLPKDILEALNKQGCTIPQSYLSDKLHNVINGEFEEKDQKDWVVLCSSKNVSSILVFWKGMPDNFSALASSPDKNWLQVFNEGKIGFSRMIEPADGKYIKKHNSK